MAITEVGCMGVKPDLNIMDQTTAESEILIGVWKTVTTKPGGPHRVYWGLETEDPSKLWAFFDWDSVEQHEQFAQAHGVEAQEDMPKVLTPGEFTKHVTMKPSSDVLQSPLTEVILLYLPRDLPQHRRDATAEQLQDVIEKIFGTCTDTEHLAHGWGLQNDFPIRGKEGQVGCVLMGFIGWSSADAQSRFQKTDAYGEAMALMRDIKEVVTFYKFSMRCLRLERETK
ncbi:hypothetical protein FZEAL_9850 [Fusarium zealandicum]|uniref:ABM domain-containing protein n=1 Tax=Fusarium zealandicum TaxID=1053134 RepID=A0A8H4U8C3_9HYPO|nr:hypothetical protein FZEAL_9850 [Fusarium zealandicum]